MAFRVGSLPAVAGLCVLLAGCGLFERPQRPAWRAQAEQACLAQHLVQASAYAQPAPAVDGPSICGLDHPFKVTALAGGTVALNATQLLGCPQIAALDQWVSEVVQPVALARFGQPVATIDSMGSYSCRPIDNIHGAHLSEHSFGNATDIGGFRLADGHEIKVVTAWTRGTDQEQAFLREVQAGACNIFTTVLAPGADMFHYNHIHLDLAMHGRTSTGLRRICKPLPKPQLLPAPGPRDGLPDAPDIDEDLDVSRNGGAPASQHMMANGGLDLAAPAPVASYRANSAAPAPAGITPPAPIGRTAGMPLALVPPAPAPVTGIPAHGARRGTLRPDGAFDPDPVSSIPGRN